MVCWNKNQKKLSKSFRLGKFIELTHRNTFIERQVAVAIIYKGNIIKGQRLDLLVEKQVIVELKSVSLLSGVATAQVLSYLKATGLQRALLINVGEKKLVDGIRRISN